MQQIGKLVEMEVESEGNRLIELYLDRFGLVPIKNKTMSSLAFTRDSSDLVFDFYVLIVC